MNPAYIDYYLCEELLSQYEMQIRNEVRKWIDQRYLPKTVDYFEQRVFPMELVPELEQMGLVGLKLNDYGGLGNAKRKADSGSYDITCPPLVTVTDMIFPSRTRALAAAPFPAPIDRKSFSPAFQSPFQLHFFRREMRAIDKQGAVPAFE